MATREPSFGIREDLLPLVLTPQHQAEPSRSPSGRPWLREGCAEEGPFAWCFPAAPTGLSVYLPLPSPRALQLVMAFPPTSPLSWPRQYSQFRAVASLSSASRTEVVTRLPGPHRAPTSAAAPAAPPRPSASASPEALPSSSPKVDRAPRRLPFLPPPVSTFCPLCRSSQAWLCPSVAQSLTMALVNHGLANGAPWQLLDPPQHMAVS